MTIAGVDYSTRAIDIAIIPEHEEPGQPAWHRFELPGHGDAFDRTRWIRDTLPARAWWDDQGVTAIGIEDPRGQAAGVMYRVQGGILQCLPLRLLVHPLIPSEWRSLVGLPGNASKDQVAGWACEHAHRTPGTGQDALDAYAIAVATRTLLARQDAA